MTTKSQNPYYDLAGVRDPEHRFYGYVHLLQRLFSAIMNHQSISLVGSVHIGKSSVLQCLLQPEIQERFESDLSHHLLVLIDLRQYLQKTSNDFFEAVSTEIITQSRERIELVSSARSGEDGFSSILDQIKEQGFHLVLLMDAFDNITRNKRFEPEFFSFLRAQATMGKVSYVTASLAPLYEACHHAIADSPFFNIFATYELGPLTWEEARALATIPAQQAGIPFSESETDWILVLAGRHPFFIQRVCHFLFEEKTHCSTREVDQQRVKNQAYRDLRPHFLAIWEHLQEPQQELLKNEGRLAGNHQREHLPELSESTLFRRFVRETCQLRLFRMTQVDLENILDNLDNIRVLGESELKHLKLVSLRMKNRTVPSSFERGIAVREVLNEAFERLQGPGIRRDESPEWLSYNILYYRYFKQHLKHNQIAARLLISPRQYYRARNKAIEVLLDTLMEMEASYNRDNDE